MALRTTTRDPLWFLVVGSAILASGGSAVFTLLVELQEEVGFETWGFGLIGGTFFVTTLIAQVGLARLADSGEARKLLVAGVVLAATAQVWFALGDSLVELMLARGLGGLGFGCWAPAARALVVSGRTEDSGRRLGILAMGETAGLVVGPFAASGLAAVGSLDLVYGVMAVATACVLPVAMRVPIAETDERTGDAPRPLQLLRRPRVRQSAVLAVALFAPVGLYESIWAKLIDDLGGSTFLIGLSIALYGLPYMVMAPIGGRLGDRHGSSRIALVGTAAVVVMTMAVAVANNIYVLLTLGVIEASINAVAYPNALAAMARATGDDEKATGQGLAGGGAIAGAGAMALIGAPLYSVNRLLAFSVAAAAVALGGLWAWRIGRSIDAAVDGSAGARTGEGAASR